MPLSPMLYKYTSLSPTNTDASVAGTPIKSEEGNSGEPPKKKQKRNKPTLSCEECVERKTKVSVILLIYLESLRTLSRQGRA